MPAVSVIMLACNSGELLQSAVESILDQTMRDLELVIVDNGSRDGSVERVLAARADARVKVLRFPENLGIGGGIASAVPLCTGTWIAIMDSDDLSHRMRLELQLKAAAADPSLDLISTDVTVIDAENHEVGTWPAFFSPAEIKVYAAYNMPFCHPTLFMRAEVMRATPYRAEFNITADFDFVVRASEQFKFGAVSLPLYRYRRHAHATSIERLKLSESYACAIRLLTARRRAGRPECVDEMAEEARRIVSANESFRDVYRTWALRCGREGFPLLAVFHTALELRERSSISGQLRYLRWMAAALGTDQGSWRDALQSIGKAPFWALLKRSGFPGFPRY